jgi:hypothetical protein
LRRDNRFPQTASSKRPRRLRWWRPGVRAAAKRDVGEAVYGLILATSVIVVSRQYNPDHAGITAVTVIGTAVVFWLAHLYAGALALDMSERRRPTRAEMREVVDRHWPLVQAGILPTAILLLGPIGLVGDAAAQSIAIGSCLAELATIGVIAARAAGGRGAVVLLSGATAFSLGVVIVLLKVVVH